MKFEIRNRWSGKVQFEAELEAKFETERYGIQLGAAIKLAIKSRADLTDAVLARADLTRADLTRADLTRAVLTRADLTDAVLTGADLTRADLTDAVLTGAVLTGADLTDADLTRADLTRADLTHFKSDFFDVLLRAPHEVEGLAAALREGRVDGSTYEGKCACLVGTIANVRGCNYQQLPNLEPNGSRPAERLFLQISKGQTPENSGVVKLTLEWIAEFQALLEAAK